MHTLIDQLDSDTLVLTGTAALAAHLRGCYAQRAREQAAEVWQTPDIVSLGAWVSSVWTEEVQWTGGSGLVLLNSAQERVLWEQCIEADLADNTSVALPARAAARLAQSAYRLQSVWRLEPAPASLDDDARAFERWCRCFERKLREHGWTHLSTATQAVIEAVRNRTVPLPQRVVVAGFDTLSPQDRSLFEAFERAGVALVRVAPEGDATEIRRIEADTAELELELAARWAHGLVCSEANASIGVIVPDLDAHRESVQRVFDSLCATPGECSPQQRYFSANSVVAAGDLPIVGDALAALQLGVGVISTSLFERLLRSAYLGDGQQEFTMRSGAVERMRSLAATELALDVINREIARSWPDAPLTRRLREFEQTVANQPRSNTPADWATAFSRRLRTLGWPGPDLLDDDERLGVRTLDALFDGLAAFSMVLPAMGASQALMRLRALARERSVSSARVDAPVQVIGLGSETGFEFSHLWLCGLHDGAWPRSPRPNPFIPAVLQRAHELPRGTSAWELEFARRAQQRWCASAGRIVYSHALHEGDRERRASPLTMIVAPSAADALAYSDARTAYQRIDAAAPQLQTLSDDKAPALLPSEAPAGGADLFKTQAACPFQAFGKHRLNAKSLGETGPGLDPLARGSLLHVVLDRLWTSVGSQASLNSMSTDSLASVIDDAVVATLGQWRARRPGTLRGRFEQMERERLGRLARRWMEMESSRAPFVVVSAEQEQRVKVGGLPVTIRPDRLDRIDEGYLVIDYKSGKGEPRSWLDPRIDEPQLPVYCTAIEDGLGQPVVGVAFGVASASEVELKGLSEVENLGSKLESFSKSRLRALKEHDDWTALKNAWRVWLDRLGRDFARGDARPDPKTPQTCQRCDLMSLCRIHERGREVADDEDQP